LLASDESGTELLEIVERCLLAQRPLAFPPYQLPCFDPAPDPAGAPTATGQRVPVGWRAEIFTLAITSNNAAANQARLGGVDPLRMAELRPIHLRGWRGPPARPARPRHTALSGRALQQAGGSLICPAARRAGCGALTAASPSEHGTRATRSPWRCADGLQIGAAAAAPPERKFSRGHHRGLNCPPSTCFTNALASVTRVVGEGNEHQVLVPQRPAAQLLGWQIKP